MRAARLILAACTIAVLGGCGGDSEPAATTAPAAPAAVPEATAPMQTFLGPEAEEQPGAKRVEAAPPKPKAIAIQAGAGKDKRVALTFDADMTPEMLTGLRDGGSKQYDEAIIRSSTARRLRPPSSSPDCGPGPTLTRSSALPEDPLLGVGNHTFDHRAWTATCYGLPAGDRRAREEGRDADRTAEEIEKATGETPSWFRFPGLCHSDTDLEIVAGAGEQAIDGLSSGDAFASDPTAVETWSWTRSSPDRSS